MVHADEPVWWYELRDLLRSDFIRCMEEGRTFPHTRQALLDRVEDLVVRLEEARRHRLEASPAVRASMVEVEQAPTF